MAAEGRLIPNVDWTSKIASTHGMHKYMCLSVLWQIHIFGRGS